VVYIHLKTSILELYAFKRRHELMRMDSVSIEGMAVCQSRTDPIVSDSSP
jgi:hypothetical protein